MDDLRDRLTELDRMVRPDLWPEIERRALLGSPAPGPITTWRAGGALVRPGRTTSMLTLPRFAAVAATAVITTGLVLAASSSPGVAPGAVGPSPSSSPGTDAAIVWDSGSVRLEADSLEIRAGDRVFTGQAPYSVRSATGSPDRRTLEVEWIEDDLEQRLYLYFAADDRDWWITEIRTRDGYLNADWLYYDEFDLLAATPRGETYEGDLNLRAGRSERDDRDVSGELSITGLRLTAFEPGSGPAELAGCEHVRASVRLQADPLDVGQPLAGSSIEDMTPAEAEAYLREQGICFTFRYLYHTSQDKSEGYSERWCTAPPAGRVNSLAYTDEDGEVVVLVLDDRVLPLRDQPPAGWGCAVG